MKKVIFIVIVTIFSCGVMAAPISSNLKGKLPEKTIIKEKKVQKSIVKFIEPPCSQKQSITIDCPKGGPTIEISVVTIFYTCSTGAIINVDVYQTGRTCPPQSIE